MNKIQELRKAKGISQDRLSKELDVSIRAVQSWEQTQSTKKMQLQMAIRLADYFECDVRDLCF